MALFVFKLEYRVSTIYYNEFCDRFLIFKRHKKVHTMSRIQIVRKLFNYIEMHD